MPRLFGPIGVGLAVLVLAAIYLAQACRPAKSFSIENLQGAELNPIISRGIEYLLSAQQIDGQWTDYRLTVGESDAWVTAVTSWTLRQSDPAAHASPEVQRAYLKSQQWLMSKRRPTGWGYNDLADTDADSTAWALRSGALDQSEPGELAVQAYQANDGGVATFIDRKWGNWSTPRNDITANMLLGHFAAPPNRVTGFDVERALAVLPRNQRPNGSWDAYWWDSDCVATALCVEALHKYGEYRDAEARARQFLLASQRPDGGWGRHQSNSIDTAVSTRALLLLQANQDASVDDAIRKGVLWLCNQQREDGNWPPSNTLAVPWTTGDAKTPVTSDCRSIMSTSFAIAALVDFRKSSHKS